MRITTGCTIPAGASPANLAGRRACALGGSATYTLYSYDPAGDITDTWDQTPDVLAHQGYGYFFNGQLASYTNPEGDSFTYTLDSPGRVTQVVAGSSWNSGETVFADASYNAPGMLTAGSMGNGSQDFTRTKNNRLEQTEIAASVGGTIKLDLAYGFDADGLPTALTDNEESAYDQTFAYDALARLTGMTVTNDASQDAVYTTTATATCNPPAGRRTGTS